MNPQLKQTFTNLQPEDFDYSDYQDYFDLVFTSPPYFNVERYGDDDTQSWVRYKSIDGWNEYFFTQWIRKNYTNT